MLRDFIILLLDLNISYAWIKETGMTWLHLECHLSRIAQPLYDVESNVSPTASAFQPQRVCRDGFLFSTQRCPRRHDDHCDRRLLSLI